MLEHDRSRHTRCAESVTAWPDAVGNVGEAAQRLGVHPNTLKYRIRRTREIFGPDAPDDRLPSRLRMWIATSDSGPGQGRRGIAAPRSEGVGRRFPAVAIEP
ncbi:helix-turn-helix domain-containing protein [Streptomyces sp. NPDC006274]|uniref:helix-turn-helix domain-containing protein n=1 Tax=unclassified Streptomyces TaxID=2593676 RepID=UPI0033BBEB64